MVRKAKEPAGIGHNSGDVLMGAAQDQLKSILDRIERIEDDELSPAKEAIKEIYAEAKGSGFNTKILRKIVTARRQDAAKRKEDQAIFDLYAHALGLDLV